jgi:hypothetical protein
MDSYFKPQRLLPEDAHPLLDLSPLARDASTEEVAAHGERAAELAPYKLGRLSAKDADGYHRVTCPALSGKVRCPLREASMMLDPRPWRRSLARRTGVERRKREGLAPRTRRRRRTTLSDLVGASP